MQLTNTISITMDPAIQKALKKIQADAILNGKTKSFSRVINDILYNALYGEEK